MATGLNHDQVKKFVSDFYELDSMYQNEVIITPERASVQRTGRITFGIEIIPINEAIADYMEKYVLAPGSLMFHWGWNMFVTIK